ncbi:PAS domain S-box protein [Halorubrum sp. CBA1125]|uniref:PAS domain S-box protein n=1 Tax=Halorubrum sp. CBA1125 TaxID=2668072 RepID=UPI0012E8BBFA|nr:PAS domain S-box protein [Halorubrum sp. CBA1125]MUW14958.1 PAS domain S-box protein [Halorubrum sp. CBA1125]
MSEWKGGDFGEPLFEAILETSIDGILVVDANREYVTWNQRFVDMWGVPEELLQEGAERPALEWVLDKLEHPGEFIEHVEYLYKHPNEKSRDQLQLVDGRTFDRYSGPVVGEDGTHYGRIWFFRDITELKEHEQALAEERDKYQTLVEESNDGIAIHQDSEFIFANEQCLEILGYNEDELIGKSFLEIVAPEDRDLIKERYERRFTSGEKGPPNRYETHFLTKDGERRVSEISAGQIHYEGEPAVLVTVRDVTERKRREARLKELNAQLEALNRLVRHDIRNDMAIILGWAELLAERAGESEQEYLDKIISSGTHIVELTEITKDYIKQLTSEEEFPVRPTSLRAIIENELDLRRASYPDAKFVLDEEIPDVSVVGNELLESVVRNLLNNAVQHNDKDEPVVRISFEVNEDDVVVQIADNGPGVPDERKESLFGKGAKGLDSLGSGIGLYLVRTLIEGYGGEVWIEDNEPEGSIFNVRLPRIE